MRDWFDATDSVFCSGKEKKKTKYKKLTACFVIFRQITKFEDRHNILRQKFCPNHLHIIIVYIK